MDSKVSAETESDPVPIPDPEESTFISDIDRGEGEHEGIGIRESGHGFLYHLKLCMLCLLRAMQIQDESSTVNMTAEHKRLNPFDDIILMYNAGGVREYHLIQVKHGQLLEEKKIIAKDFLKEKYNNWGTQFTLHKYFSGYCKLKKLPEFSSVSTNFIVCTNIDLDFDDLQKHCVSIKPCEIPHFNEIIKESNGKLYRLASKGKSVIYKALSAVKDTSDDEINNFINDFIIAVNLPNEQDLGTIIKKEIGAMFVSIDPELVAPQFQDRLLDWLKQRKGKWLSREEVNAFTKQMVDEINSLPSKGLDISYKLEKIQNLISEEHLTNFRSNIEDFLSGEENLLQIINNVSSYLSLLKIHQTLKKSKIINDWGKNTKNVILYIRFKSFSSRESRSHLKSALSNESNYKLMIIYCKKKDKLSRIFKYLYKAAKICSKMKKKIIIVTGKDIDVEELEEDIPNLKMRREEDEGFEYSQVSNESGECLLSKKLVSFQGSSEKTSLSLLVVAEDEERQLELRNKLKHIIDSEILIKLIKDKEFRVGNFVEENKVLSDIYIERQLENDKTHEVIHEKDLVRISNRVVIIIDEAGSGKSTLMNSLIRNLKEAYPNIWVCRINLINYSEIFFKEVMLRKDGKKSYNPGEEESTLNFFIDTLLDSQPVTKLKTPFDKSLFRLALQGYMKLFLVFDGFDEICPNYKDVVLELMFSLHQLKFEKLYITSRKNENTSPIKIPEGAYLKNVPLTTEQQMQFLVDYWAKEANVEDEKTVVKLREIATKSRGKIGVTIIKNPLMLLLTAEYLKDAITIMCKEPDQVSISFQYALFLTHRNRKMNFIEVCRSFIEKKIIIYQIDKSKQSLGNISSENKHYYFINAVQSVHTYLALIAIFGQEEALKMNRDMPDVNDEYIRIELPKIGLVYEQGNTFQFIHRTFTDFFVTEFIRGHPKKCAPVMETFVKDLPYSWWDAVFEYITDGWFDCSNINREVIDRIKYVLTYIALVRRFRKQTTIELTGDEGPNIEDIKDELLSLGLLKEGRRKSRNWEGLSFVYWRMADYFVKNFIDMHRAEALTVSNYNHADKMERFFKWEE